MDQEPTARHVMDPSPTVLRPSDTMGTAVAHIMAHRYRTLPVVDGEGRYLGVFGVNCLLRSVLPHAAIMDHGLTTVPFIRETLADLKARLLAQEEAPIAQCMSTDAVTVPPDTPLVETLLVLYRNRASVPVVDPESGRLEGMISYFDVGERILSA